MSPSSDPAAADLLAAAAAAGLHLCPGTARVDTTGWDFLVLHATAPDGTRWVVRLPRRPEVAAHLHLEGRLLDLLRPRLPVAIPHWRIRTPHLVAYPRLPGEPAATEDPDTLVFHWRSGPPPPTPPHLEQLARTLVALHATPLPQVTAVGLPHTGPEQARERIAALLDAGRSELGVPEPLWTRWQRWLHDPVCWPDRTVLVHGDVHPGHTLLDTAGRLTGLIDWADARIDDPADDFTDQFLAHGAPALDHLLAAYARSGGHVWPGMRRHVMERAAVGTVYSGLFGLSHGRPHYADLARARMARLTCEPTGT